jgi:hypothetical protein
MITVEKTGDEMRVIIPSDAITPDRLNSFLDRLRFEEVAQRSRLTDEQVDRLAEDLKHDWWRANKEQFLPSSEPKK